MIIDQDDNTVVITQEKTSTIEHVKKIEVLYQRFENNNIIVNITKIDKLQLADFTEFLQLSNRHRKTKHSFVIVSNTLTIDELPDELMVVPTTSEAFDIIEMEIMERDLGF